MITTEPTTPRVMVPELLRIERASKEIADVFTFRLDVSQRPGGFAFAPGQFNMLYLFGVGEVAISISGDPARTDQLVHTIRAVGTVTRAMEQLKKGDLLGVRGPFGAPWPLDEAKGRDLVIIAGGLGLAPLRPAILAALARRDDFAHLVILYGARTPADILYKKEIERWRGRLDTQVEVTVDRAETSYPGHVGVVSSLLGLARFDPGNAVAMLCGPEVMMRFTARDLTRLGMPKDRIHVSMERNMKCGAGLCGHCQLGPAFVCKDGPVFRYDRAERLFYTREI
jgi:NAD(P)H-flavin reductase